MADIISLCLRLSLCLSLSLDEGSGSEAGAEQEGKHSHGEMVRSRLGPRLITRQLYLSTDLEIGFPQRPAFPGWGERGVGVISRHLQSQQTTR